MIESADPILAYQPLWGKWSVDALIGSGSYGRVYKVTRSDLGEVFTSAVKHIRVPSSPEEIRLVQRSGMDAESVRRYFNDSVNKIANEITLMYRLRNKPNIVAYEDHEIIQHGDQLLWDILIRMELLTPLNEYVRSHPLDANSVRRLGMELCAALEACSESGIVHRDVKDSNIFIDDNGTFKLGDFGIARYLAEGSRSMSMRGTPAFLAPEIYRGQKYDSRVDIYSLGIVLYKLLNGGRYPLLPASPTKITHNDVENAFIRRMKGEPLPPPNGCDSILGEIVQKACAFDPAERFSTAAEMGYALQTHQKIDIGCPPAAKPKRKWIIPVLLVGIVTALAAAILLFLRPNGRDSIQTDASVALNTSFPAGSASSYYEPEEPLSRKGHLSIRDLVAARLVQDAGYGRYRQQFLACSEDITAAILLDGSVIAVGGNYNQELACTEWMNISALAAREYYIAGVASDGRVHAIGYNSAGQLGVTDWADISGLSAGYTHLVGLTSNGMAVAAGDNSAGQCRVDSWSDLKDLAAGEHHTAGLLRAGTVLAAGDAEDPACFVNEWSEIAAIAAGYSCTIGLTEDGFVVAAGSNSFGECSVGGWTDIAMVACGAYHTVGLKNDGTVVAVGLNDDGQCDVSEWRDIVAIAAGTCHTVGLCADGTFVSTGRNSVGQCNLSGWNIWGNIQ